MYMGFLILYRLSFLNCIQTVAQMIDLCSGRYSMHRPKISGKYRLGGLIFLEFRSPKQTFLLDRRQSLYLEAIASWCLQGAPLGYPVSPIVHVPLEVSTS